MKWDLDKKTPGHPVIIDGVFEFGIILDSSEKINFIYVSGQRVFRHIWGIFLSKLPVHLPITRISSAVKQM